MPAEAGHHAVRGARVLDLDHGSLARLVGGVRRFRDHAVQAGALEPLEPLGGRAGVFGHGRQVERRAHSRAQPLEQSASLLLRRCHGIAAAGRQKVERHERRRRRLRQQRRNARSRLIQRHRPAQTIAGDFFRQYLPDPQVSRISLEFEPVRQPVRRREYKRAFPRRGDVPAQVQQVLHRRVAGNDHRQGVGVQSGNGTVQRQADGLHAGQVRRKGELRGRVLGGSQPCR